MRGSSFRPLTLALLLSSASLSVSATSVSPSQTADPLGRVLADTIDSVVQIRNTVRWPFGNDKRGSSKGAGFVIDAERGWIATNAHVVSSSPSKVSVNFRNEEPVDAKKIYVDPLVDFAILQIPATALPKTAKSLSVECSAKVPLGVAVGAVGHPGGLVFTATKGIVSGETSRFGTEFLQTDAPINPGNSGGPLVELDSGRVLGISTAAVSGSQNTNFALAGKHFCGIVELLRRDENPSPPRFPFSFFAEHDASFQLKVAASTAKGVSVGESIVGVSGKGAVKNPTELASALRGLTKARILVRGADGLSREEPITLLPEQKVLGRKGVAFAGALVAPVEEKMSGFPIPPLSLHFVEPGSQAENAELSKGDFLLSVDGRQAASVEELSSLVSGLSGKEVLVRVKRVSNNSSGQDFFSFHERKLLVGPVRDIVVGEDDLSR